MNKEQQEKRKKSPVQIRNKKASFEYFFVDTYTAGIVLTGTEIKSKLLLFPSVADESFRTISESNSHLNCIFSIAYPCLLG